MAKNWLTSPLGIKVVMNLRGKDLKKHLNVYTNITEILKMKEHFVINNKLFLLTSVQKCMIVRNKSEIQATTLENNQEFATAIRNWVQQYGCFQKFMPEKHTNSKGLLINVCMYKGTWKGNKNNLVTVYNSFSYTEDIKYEPRILVMPTSNDGVVLAIVVPNEGDVLGTVAAELKEKGLAAALNSIKPAFAVTCKQALPTFAFESAVEFKTQTDETIATQYGEIRTDENGVDVKVLTCLPINDEKSSVDYRTPPTSSKCFNFAIVYKDIPIFTGQVLQ